MPTRDAYDPGTPCWIDLNTPDVDASKTFYSGLFSWDVEDSHDDDGTWIYANFTKDGAVVAGLGAQQPQMAGMPPIWSSYVSTDDVDATVGKVADAGGTVMMPPMDVMTEGRMAIVADPTGAVIAAWQPGRHIGATVVNEPDTWAWNELLTRDLDAATPFYAAVFGWEYDVMDMGGGQDYTVVRGGPEGIAGMMAMPDGMPEQVPNHWAVYFLVDDADAAAAKAVELGGQITMPASDTPVGRIAGLHDPAGGSFQVMQPNA